MVLEKLEKNILLTRGGAVVARRAHNPKVVGSNPAPATSFSGAPFAGAFSWLNSHNAGIQRRIRDGRFAHFLFA